MSKNKSEELGSKPISKLILSQSIPASIGILVMSLNIIVDTIFVGNWIGALAIAAITVVLPIIFLISSFGMAIGIGGASIISRALGEKKLEKAQHTFGNQITLAVGVSLLLSLLGIIFKDEALFLFGAKGRVVPIAVEYYSILIVAVPFLALVMTGNPIIRAEGKPKFSMIAMIIPAIANIVLDYLFIVIFDYGIVGAAWATAIAYCSSFLFVVLFFVSDNSELKIKFSYLKLKRSIVNQISALGGVTLARQGVVSLFLIVLHHTVVLYGGEESLAIYGVISRMLMFALFPIMGIAQGLMPIVGYNFGANNILRLKETISKSIIYASLLAFIIFVLIMVFPTEIVRIFTNDPFLLAETPAALRVVFAVTPLISIQLIGSSYFQAIGKAKPALFLTLSKQGFFLIPLILILPNYYGMIGIWIAFPIADFLSTLITGIFVHFDLKKLVKTV